MWEQQTALFSDNQVNHMACGVLVVAGTPYIFCVGGSASGTTTTTNRVTRYDPVTDTFGGTYDAWPGNISGADLPGGFAVYSNRLYILGGFQINVGTRNWIWEFDPTRPSGSQWVQKAATLGQPLGYVPAATIGQYIYTAGGSVWDGTTLHDSIYTYRYDPLTDTLCDGCVPELPRMTADTRAVNFNGELWVLGGGRDAPNPSNVVQRYVPSGSWNLGPNFTTPRRSFLADTDGTSHIFVIGGYAPTIITNTMEIYRPPYTCGTPTPGPTTTPTPCTISFTDVDANDPFYPFIRCLVCRFIISGYSDGTFRPNNEVTRGQLSKIVANSAGFSEPASGQTYEDVPSIHPFYAFIEKMTARGIMGGYPCGGPGEPCGPDNKPYFRSGANATRGQISKIVSNAAGYNEPVSGQIFEDVPPSNPFYEWIHRLTSRGIMGGYPCGGPGEPCDPQQRPYFRWGVNATRGQISKISAQSFFPNCQTPSAGHTQQSPLPNPPVNSGSPARAWRREDEDVVLPYVPQTTFYLVGLPEGNHWSFCGVRPIGERSI